MFKVNNKDTRAMLTLNVNFERITHLVLVFLLLTLAKYALEEFS